MKRFLLAISGCTLLAFTGCLPNNYYSQLLANTGVAVVSAVLSQIYRTLVPA